MSTLNKRFGQLLLVSSLVAAAVACGSDGNSDGEETPPVLDDGDGDNGDGDNGDGDNGDGDNGDGDNGDGDNGDGDGPQKDCFDEPKTNLELLNQCLPAGSKVDSRKFDNKARIPNFTGTLPPLAG